MGHKAFMRKPCHCRRTTTETLSTWPSIFYTTSLRKRQSQSRTPLARYSTCFSNAGIEIFFIRGTRYNCIEVPKMGKPRLRS